MRTTLHQSAQAVLSWLDRQLIGSVPLHQDDAKPEKGWPFGWAPGLALLSGMSLLLMTHAANMRAGEGNAPSTLFYVAIALSAIPICSRLAWPDVTRTERLSLVIIATLMLFGGRLIREPVAFIDHDTMLHWVTANQMLEHHRLFTPNPLLPVSPLFPGIEIVATAIANVTGLPIFEASVLLALVARLVFISAIFLSYELVTGSSLIAGLGCMIYAGSSNFFLFDASFSYEALALSLLGVLVLVMVLAMKEQPFRPLPTVVFVAPLALAISVTHHMTAYVTAGLLVALAVLLIAQRPMHPRSFMIAGSACVCAAIVSMWPLMRGGSVDGYLGPLFESALAEVTRMLTSSSGGRVPFQATTGHSLPKWQIFVTIASVVLIAFGLSRGFLRALQHAGCKLKLHPWPLSLNLFSYQNTWLVLLTLVTLLWPISIVLRLTAAGWEIGNRIGPFAYLGIGVIASIGLMSASLRNLRSFPRAVVVGFGVVMIVNGGIISSAGNDLLPRIHYRPAADAASIEPTGISAAEWANAWLGPGNRFISDRVNNLLLATYGQQRILTPLYDQIEAGPLLLLSETIGKPELELIREHDLGFIMSDLRLTTDLPAFGFYMNPSSEIDRDYRMPLEPELLLKFNDVEGIDRVFDNGNILIFDVRGLAHG